MGEDETPERPPRPDRGPPEHPSIPLSPERPRAMEATSERSQSWRRRRATSPTPSEQSDDESSSRPHTKNRLHQSWMRIEAFILVQDLDKLVQERVGEASMPHNRKCRAISIDAHPILSSLRPYWNIDFSRSLWFWSWLLFWLEWLSPAPPSVPEQDPFQKRLHLVLDLPLQLERGCLRLVLLSSVTFNP